jgi:hydrogenase maturation protein HypF
VARVRLAIDGTVQGVGFRPFVYREASRRALTGWVRNVSGRVEVEVEGPLAALDAFVRSLSSAPPPAHVTALVRTELAERNEPTFEIVASEPVGPVRSTLPADLAPCAECMHELFDPSGRRHGYAFTACAACGPRYSTVETLPYDRRGTTLAEFALCAACEREYLDPNDRRFHAEAVACPACGPSLTLLGEDGRPRERGNHALRAAAEALGRGQIVLLRGVGGFQFVVDATDANAVERLRERKRREEKPFAVLFATLAEARRYARLSDAEAALLASPAAPIVLAERRDGAEPSIAEGVAPNNPRLGCMLPASPLHVLLARARGVPLVCTSGNSSGEPLCLDDEEAAQRLGGMFDLMLTHDRPIARPLDDSLVRVGPSGVEVWRRARGYTPKAVATVATDRSILALGAQLKAAPALLVGGALVLGQHVGDLHDARTLAAFERTLDDLMRFFRVRPDAIACDMHPDYASSLHAETLARRLDVPLFRVQHHHAHVAAVMAEHGLSGPALGIAWDGSGLGLDDGIWGSEFLLLDGARFRRFAHLAAFRLPGGDRSARQPARSALGLLHSVDRSLAERWGARWFSPGDLRALLLALERGLNCPQTTSLGRVFDAVAALLGLRTRATFEGQAAMELEFAASSALAKHGANSSNDPYSLPLRPGDELVGDTAPLVHAILDDLARGVSRDRIALRFHVTLIDLAVRVAEHAAREHVVLSGGCFQNRFLAFTLARELRARGHRVATAREIPCNDGGLAAGQAFIAALRLSHTGDRSDTAKRTWV